MSEEHIARRPTPRDPRREGVRLPPGHTPLPAFPHGRRFQAELLRSSWLRRAFLVETPLRTFEVEYNGRGMGYESVLVDGVLAAREGAIIWFAPRFDFYVGTWPAALEVRVWPWFVLRSLALWVDGELVYSEGRVLP
jgi:hypothetical protein